MGDHRRAHSMVTPHPSPSAQAPVAIGGVGGSGTRLLAEVLQGLGMHIGDDLNPARDNLWFTLLFKRREILGCDDAEFGRLVRTFQAAMIGGRSLDAATHAQLATLSRKARPAHTTDWLEARAKSLLKASERAGNHCWWGWKEPNTHVVIERLWQWIPDLRYIHVMRHGLDMAHSRNQHQVMLWGRELLQGDVEPSPQRSLTYWCGVHRRVNALLADHPDRVYLLDYDRFCAEPASSLVALRSFLGISDAPHLDVEKMIQPRKAAKHWQPLHQFNPEDLTFLQSMGYGLQPNA